MTCYHIVQTIYLFEYTCYVLSTIELLRIVPTLRVVTNEPIFRNSNEISISKFPASLDIYRGVIISKTSKISKSNLARNVFEAHRSASLGPGIKRSSTRFQPLDYSRILPKLIVRL